MKKLCLITLIMLSIFNTSFSQEKQNSKSDDSSVTNFNDVKLNSLYLILGAFEVSYERSLNEESGVGIDIFLPFDDEVQDDINYYISPYYRIYIGNNYASGFFIEGFGMLNSTKNYTFSFDTEINEDITDFALGIGLGGKFLTKRGFIGELNLGIGRNLFNDKNDRFDNEIIGKAGIRIGYRF